MQESGEARRGAVERGLEGELDDGGTIAARAWLSVANRCARAPKGRRTRTATPSSNISMRRRMSFSSAPDRWSLSTRRRRSWSGDFKNAGREWQPKGHPEKSMVHDFPQDAAGKAIPYGIYDMGRNEAWVSVGCDHDTPAFAVASLRRWWEEMGRSRYPEARELFITADAGGQQRLPLARVEAGATAICRRHGSARTRQPLPAPAPASGTRLSTACSVTSRTIGEASHCEPSKPSSI